MSYKLIGYYDGKSVGECEYDELFDAIAGANEALHGSKGPTVEEFEITVDIEYASGKRRWMRETVLVYGSTEDAFRER